MNVKNFVNYGTINEIGDAEQVTITPDGIQVIKRKAPPQPTAVEEAVIVSEAEAPAPQDIDREAEEALEKANAIFVAQLPSGKAVSLCRLKRFVDEWFEPYVESKYHWVALWKFLKEKKLLMKNCRTYQAFADQITAKEWYGSDCCDKESLSRYAVVDDYGLSEWDKAVERSNKVSESGIAQLRQLYQRMEEKYDEGLILKR